MASPNGPATGFDFTDAPGGDISLDDLFPSPEGNSSAETPAELAGQPQSAQPTPPAPEDFLRSPDGKIVYKSADDALRGMAEKDRVIEQLRQEFIAREGYDPISRRRVNSQQPQSQPQSEPQLPQSYLQNPMKFYQDQVDAVKANDAAKYTQTQLKLVEEYLAPLAPLVADLARSRALQSVENVAPDAKSFVGSQEYQKVLDSKPALSRAIQAAEQNFQFYGDLPELYSLAWEAHQTSRLPELLRAQQPNQGSVVPNTPPARPTTTSTSTLTPPTQPAAPKDFRTHEGRMSIIREAEGRGVDKVVW